jgi:hypothetical protein
MYAQDAHASVTFLSLLMFLWGVISLFSVPMKPFGPWNLLQAVAGAVAIAYFVSTRKRPSTRVSIGFALVMILYSLILLPWTAMVWCRLGRPWEAFTVPQVGMVSMALVVPRYFWLGVGMLALFAAESVFAYVYAHHLGLYSQTPPTEPYFSLFFAILGVGMLMLRDQRRQLALSHIRMQAEGEALQRIGPLFDHFRDELGDHLAALTSGLRSLPDEPSAARPLLRMDRAADRLASLSGRLHGLFVGATIAAPAGDSHPPRDRLTRLVASDVERQLLARDAHTGTTVFLAMLAAATVVLLLKHEVIIGARLFPVAVGEAIFIFAMLLYVVSTRQHPSERRAMWVVLVVSATLLPLLTLNEESLIGANRPYAPFMGHKFLMVGMALVAGGRLRLSLVLILLTAASAVAAFFLLHMGARRDLISVSEPWVTLVFMLIGIVVLMMRERRRVASIQLLRAESETAADYRRAALILALRDELNSPLQCLLSSAAALELDPQRSRDISQVRVAVDGLVALSRELAQIGDVIPSGSDRVSFDAARELAPPITARAFVDEVSNVPPSRS